MNLRYPKPSRTILLSALLLMSVMFTIFRTVSYQEGERAKFALSSLLRSEYTNSNAWALARSLANFENIGLARCIRLYPKGKSDRPFYDTSINHSCFQQPWLVSLTSSKMTIQSSMSGIDYDLSYVLPVNYAQLLLELVCYLVVLLALKLHSTKVRVEQEIARHETQRAADIEAITKQVSHDIRSPLTALNMVLKRLTVISNDETILVHAAIQRINDIAGDVLQKKYQAAEVESDAHLIEPTQLTCDVLESLVTEKLEQFSEAKDLVVEKSIKVRSTLPSAVDQVELSRLVSNILNNAIEATQEPEELATRTRRVQVSLYEKNDQQVISIRDNGRGIPADIIKKLGQCGFSYGKRDRGNGLGLYHAKRYLEKIGGALLIHSVPGQGTTVDIELPA